MKLFKRIVMIFIAICCSFVLISANSRVNATDVAIYTFDFEDSTGHRTSGSNDYTTEKTYTDKNVRWTFVYADSVTSGSPISGSANILARIANNTTNSPTITSSLIEADSITKIEYKVKASSKTTSLLAQYSTDGSNWTNLEDTYTVDNTLSTKSYSDLNIITGIYLKFTITASSSAGSNRDVQIDDIILYDDQDLSSLTVPTSVQLSNMVVSFDSVTNASSYEIGLFASSDATEPLKTFTITEITYTINYSAQGTFYVKVKANGDNENYSDSAYSSSAGSYTNNTISEKSVAEMLVIATESSSPYTYYEVSGIVSNVVSNTYSVNIVDTHGDNDDLYINSIPNFESYDFQIGDRLTVTGYKSSDTTLSSITVKSNEHDYKMTFAAINTMASMNFNYSANNGESCNGYELVTDASTLAANDELIIASSNSFYVLSATQKPNNRDGVQSIFSNHNFSTTTNVAIITLGGNADAWTLGVMDGETSSYLYAAGGTESNCLRTDATLNTTGYWAISISDGLATIVCTDAAVTRNTLKYNSSNNLFSCYESGQSLVRIYRKTTVTPKVFSVSKEEVNSIEKEIVSLKFGGLITSALKEALDLSKESTITYGIVYVKVSDITGDTKTLAAAIANSEATYQEVTPVKTDASGVASDSGTYYQLGVSLNHIPVTDFDEKVIAACYVCIDGVYTYMTEKEYSVNTIAEYYVKNLSNNAAVLAHWDILNWLISYAGE